MIDASTATFASDRHFVVPFAACALRGGGAGWANAAEIPAPWRAAVAGQASALGENWVTMRTCESKSELLELLSRSKSRTVLVGADVEAPRQFQVLQISSSSGSTEVGLIASGYGPKSVAFVFADGKRAVIGHDASLTWIDLRRSISIAAQHLTGAFFDFTPVAHGDEVIVLHELGVARIDGEGRVKWSVDTELVEDWSLDGGTLRLKVMDAPMAIVAIDNGSVVLAKT